MRISEPPPLAPELPGIGHNQASTTDVLKDRFADLMQEVENLANRANEARDALGNPPECKTDEQRDLLTKLGLEAHRLAKRLDETKLGETKPLRDQVAEINGFFSTITARPENIKAAFQRLVGDYDQKKRDEERRRAAEDAARAREEARQKLEEAAATTQGVMSDVVMNEAAAAEHRANYLEKQAMAAGSGPTRTEGGTISHVKKWDFRIVDAGRIDLNQLRPHLSIADIEKAIRAFVRANRDTVKLPGVEIFPDNRTQFRG